MAGAFETRVIGVTAAQSVADMMTRRFPVRFFRRIGAFIGGDNR